VWTALEIVETLSFGRRRRISTPTRKHNDRLGGYLADADHGAQRLNLASKRGDLDFQELIELGDLGAEVVDRIEVAAQHEGVVLTEATFERQA